MYPSSSISRRSSPQGLRSPSSERERNSGPNCSRVFFSQALKKLRKHSAHTFVEATINNQIRKFRDLIRPIRDHRDSYIAHHSKRHRAHLKPPELLPAIRLAVEITDALAEHEVTYRLGDIDLRKDILGHPKATIKHGA